MAARSGATKRATTTVATNPRDVEDFEARASPAIGPKQSGWVTWLLWVAASIAGNALSAAGPRGSAMLLPENTPPIAAGAVSIVAGLLLLILPGLLHWL